MSKLDKMRREMESAVEHEAYERAAQLRDQLRALDARQQKKVSQARSSAADADE